MKAKGLHTLWVALLLFVFAGCATPKIDWDSRVGNYTYDQALLEFGPPDKAAKTSNGILVAEWLTSRGYSGGYYPSYFYGYYHYYYHPVQFYDPPSPDRYMRMTFDADGILKSWKRLWK
jgi:hypothetical protein